MSKLSGSTKLFNRFTLMVRENDRRRYKVALSLGSNLGDREKYLNQAKQHISDQIGVICLSSSRYETEGWGGADLQPFINEVILLESKYDPKETMNICLGIEALMGRERKKIGYQDRRIDIDVIFYEEMVINEEFLILPHPRLHLRKFVLVPLNEVCADWVHPLLKKNVKELLENCKDQNNVKKYL